MIGKPLNLSPEERVKHKKKLQERYRNRNRERINEYNRLRRVGLHKKWETDAFIKAGGVL